MSSIEVSVAEQPTARNLGDSFGVGLLVMLIVSGFQRVVGLVRGLGFCYFLTDAELGMWSLANSFFMIAVPIVMLGLPGSLGKYVEYYRSRGQLSLYVRRVIRVATIGLFAGSTLVLLFAKPFAWVVFGEPTGFETIALCVAALVGLCCYSIVYELVGAFRQIRVLSIMQFGQSFGFAFIGLLALAITRSWVSLLPSFAIANFIAMTPGLWVLHQQHRDEFSGQRVSKGTGEVANAMWRRILPYAVMLWLMNLLSNLFEVSDRYMLLHFVSSGAESVGQQLVGQRHAAYILPNLLTSVALTMAGILLPYLSADWEGGKFEAIASRMRQMIKGMCIASIGLATLAMLAAPLLYDFAFHGKYDLAEEVLPICLLQATWVSLFLIAETHLLCAERGKHLIVLLLGGLCLNFALNWLLIPSFGLNGAVVATSLANLTVLMLLYRQMGKARCHLGWGTSVLSLIPISILGGPVSGMAALVVVVFVAGRTDWLLDEDDRTAIDAAILPKLQRLGLNPATLWV